MESKVASVTMVRMSSWVCRLSR